jgi:hypothetical protein
MEAMGRSGSEVPLNTALRLDVRRYGPSAHCCHVYAVYVYDLGRVCDYKVMSDDIIQIV